MAKFIKLAVLAALVGHLSLRTQGAVAGKGNDNGAQFVEIGGCNRVVVVLPNETGGPEGEGYVLLPETVLP